MRNICLAMPGDNDVNWPEVTAHIKVVFSHGDRSVEWAARGSVKQKRWIVSRIR